MNFGPLNANFFDFSALTTKINSDMLFFGSSEDRFQRNLKRAG